MNRQGWTPRPERTPVYTDLMQVLQVMNEHSTAAGDGIAVQVPAYPPVLATIEHSGRHIVPIPAHETGPDGRSIRQTWQITCALARAQFCCSSTQRTSLKHHNERD